MKKRRKRNAKRKEQKMRRKATLWRQPTLFGFRLSFAQEVLPNFSAAFCLLGLRPSLPETTRCNFCAENKEMHIQAYAPLRVTKITHKPSTLLLCIFCCVFGALNRRPAMLRHHQILFVFSRRRGLAPGVACYVIGC